MDFDDIFESERKHKKHHYHHDDHHDHYEHYEHYEEHRPRYTEYNKHDDIKYRALSMLKNNPQLKWIIITVGIFLLLLIVFIIVLLIPLIGKLFHFVTENGLKGIVEAIWSGTK